RKCSCRRVRSAQKLVFVALLFLSLNEYREYRGGFPTQARIRVMFGDALDGVNRLPAPDLAEGGECGPANIAPSRGEKSAEYIPRTRFCLPIIGGCQIRRLDDDRFFGCARN